jgi:hypothetical protein
MVHWNLLAEELDRIDPERRLLLCFSPAGDEQIVDPKPGEEGVTTAWFPGEHDRETYWLEGLSPERIVWVATAFRTYAGPPRKVSGNTAELLAWWVRRHLDCLYRLGDDIRLLCHGPGAEPQRSIPFTETSIRYCKYRQVRTADSPSKGQRRTKSSTDNRSTDRRSLVDTFLKTCKRELTVTVTRKNIWQSVGHANARQFQYWQSGSPKATKQDDVNFSRILRMTPTEFERLLKNKG